MDTTRSKPPAPPVLDLNLQGLYQQLTAVLDEVQDRLVFETRPGERICLAVLEDDLTLLVEECENYLVGNFDPKLNSWRSLLSRAECILEEFDSLATSAKRRKPTLAPLVFPHRPT